MMLDRRVDTVTAVVRASTSCATNPRWPSAACIVLAVAPGFALLFMGRERGSLAWMMLALGVTLPLIGHATARVPRSSGREAWPRQQDDCGSNDRFAYNRSRTILRFESGSNESQHRRKSVTESHGSDGEQTASGHAGATPAADAHAHIRTVEEPSRPRTRQVSCFPGCAVDCRRHAPGRCRAQR
jgi:hypothetical protein